MWEPYLTFELHKLLPVPDLLTSTSIFIYHLLILLTEWGEKRLIHFNSNDLLIIDVLTRAGCLTTLNNHPNPVSNCLTF